MHDVILLTIDSLRYDRLNRTLFPACNHLFESEFAQFTSAYSLGVATPIAFPGIITGYPATGDGSLPEEHTRISEIYDGHTWARTNNPHLRPERDYQRGFDSFTTIPHTPPKSEASFAATDSTTTSQNGMLREAINRAKSVGRRSDRLRHLHWRLFGDVDRSVSDNRAEHIVSAVTEGITDVSSNGLWWAHFMDPHYPFLPQNTLDRRIATGFSDKQIDTMNTAFKNSSADTNALNFLFDMYEQAIGYLDRRLAELFEWLKAAGRWDESLIIVTADHGEAFGELGVYGHDWSADPIESLIHIPLLVKFPGGQHSGEQFGHLVSTGDIPATIAAAVGANFEDPPQTAPLTDPTERIVVSKSNTAVRVTTSQGTRIRRDDGTVDATGDPVGREAKAILNDETTPSVDRLGEWMGSSNDETELVEERLEALGYR